MRTLEFYTVIRIVGSYVTTAASTMNILEHTHICTLVQTPDKKKCPPLLYLGDRITDDLNVLIFLIQWI